MSATSCFVLRMTYSRVALWLLGNFLGDNGAPPIYDREVCVCGLRLVGFLVLRMPIIRPSSLTNVATSVQTVDDGPDGVSGTVSSKPDQAMRW